MSPVAHPGSSALDGLDSYHGKLRGKQIVESFIVGKWGRLTYKEMTEQVSWINGETEADVFDIIDNLGESHKLGI